MSLKTLACVAVAACGLFVSAKDAAAQNLWNPLNGFNRPAYGSGSNCRNGFNGMKPIGSASCSNGKCGTQCGPAGCGTNNYGYGSNYRLPSNMPSYGTMPGYFDARRLPATRGINHRNPNAGYGGVNPFYP